MLLLLLSHAPRAWGQDSLIFETALEKIWDLKEQAHPDSALRLAEALLPSIKLAKDKAREGNCYILMGLSHRDLGNYNQSYALFKQALDIRRSLGDQKGVASVYNNVASVKRLEERYMEAVDTVGQSILIYRDLADSLNLANAFVTLSNIYQDYRNFETAAVWLLQAIAVYRLKGDSAHLADAEYNFANLYYQLEKYDSALVHYTHALRLYRAQGDTLNEGLSHNMLGAIFLAKGNLADAWGAQESAEALLKTIKNREGLFKVYFGKGLYFQQREQFDKAAEQFRLAQKTGTADDSQQLSLLESLAETYRALGLLDSASHYDKIAADASRILFRNDEDSSIIEQSLQKWREKQEIQQHLANQTKDKTHLLYVAFLLVCILVCFMYWFYVRQKANALERNRQLQTIKELTNNLELNYVNARLEGQQAQQKILGRDLHDRIGAMMATLKWRYEAIGEKLAAEPELQQLIRDANHTFGAIYQNLRDISHQLESEGSVETVELVAALQGLCEAISKSGNINASVYVHGLEGRLDYKTEISLLHILQEIVANTLKHSEAQNLTIQLTKIEQQLTLMVEDDGKGFEPSRHRAGVGLRHIEERVAALGGTLQIDSDKKAGVTTIIQIPLASPLDHLTTPIRHDKTDPGLFGG